MLKFVTKREEVEDLISEGLSPEDTIFLVFEDTSVSLAGINIPCSFSMSGLYKRTKDLTMLPTKVNGLLSLTEIYAETCHGMPEEVGGIFFDASTGVDSWLGFQNTYITSGDKVQRIVLPRNADLVYHPHSSKKLHSLQVALPSDVTQYLDTDFFINQYLHDDNGVHDKIVDLIAQEAAQSLLETI